MASRARWKLLKSLDRASAREREGLYLVEGARLVAEALAAPAPVTELFVTERFAASPAAGPLLDRAERLAIPVERVPERDFDRVAATTTPQGVLAVIRREPPDPAALAPPGLLVALDGVADPGNVGTIVRAADAFGARAVIAGPGTADFENPKVLRAAMGSSFHLALFRVEDLPEALAARREAGFEIVATVLDGEDLYAAGPARRPAVVVFGNEARGVSPEVRAIADRRLTVPCPGRAESLNVAMAAAVVLSRLAPPAASGP